MLRFVGVSVVLVSLVTLVACSKAPDTELAAARDGIRQAREGDAESYANPELSRAADSLEVAERLIAEQNDRLALLRNYDRATAALAEAQVLTTAATDSSAARKERTRLEAQDLVARADAAMEATRDLLAAAPVGKDNQMEVELIRKDLDALVVPVAEAKAALQEGNFMRAKTKAVVAVGRAESLVRELSQAGESGQQVQVTQVQRN